MTIRDVQALLDAKLICGEDKLDQEVQHACSADLMSDVLAFVGEATVILTGLINHHVMRTADMLDVFCICFVRGKQVPDELVEIAKEQGLVILTTDETLYTSGGRLYAAGLPGCERKV